MSTATIPTPTTPVDDVIEGASGIVSNVKSTVRELVSLVISAPRSLWRSVVNNWEKIVGWAMVGVGVVAGLALLAGLVMLNVMFGAFLFSVSPVLGWLYVGWIGISMLSAVIMGIQTALAEY